MKTKFEEVCQEQLGTSLKSCEEYGHFYGEKLGDKQYFHGEELGVVDLSLYGMVLGFAEGGTAGSEEFLANEAVGAWFHRVQETVGTEFFSK